MDKKPFNFSFCIGWIPPYIDILSTDDKLIEIRVYASEKLDLMQKQLLLVDVRSKDFSFDFSAIKDCVYGLKTVIFQCDNRLNPIQSKDNVKYTGKLSQMSWK